MNPPTYYLYVKINLIIDNYNNNFAKAKNQAIQMRWTYDCKDEPKNPQKGYLLRPAYIHTFTQAYHTPSNFGTVGGHNLKGPIINYIIWDGSKLKGTNRFETPLEIFLH